MDEALHNRGLHVALGVVVCVTVLSFGLTISMYWRKSKQRRPVWSAIAASRGGVLHALGRVWNGKLDAIEVDVAQARVYLDLAMVGEPGRPDVVTRCRAGFLLPHGPRFRVHRRGLLARIGKALGAREVILGGHEEFARHFVVKCDAPELVSRVLTLYGRDRMVHHFPYSVLESDGAVITLRTLHDHRDRDMLEATLKFVGMLASTDLFGVSALCSLPGAVYHPPEGPWDRRTLPYVTLTQPAPVMLQPVSLQGRAVTQALLTGCRARPLELRVRDSGGIEPAEPAAHAPPDVVAMLRQLGSGTLRIDDTTASFTWDHVETERERLRAAIDLLARLAGDPLPAPHADPAAEQTGGHDAGADDLSRILEQLDELIGKITPMLQALGSLPADDLSRKAELLAEIVAAIAPILGPLGSELAQRYEYQDRLPPVDVHEYFDERGLALVDYPRHAELPSRPTHFSDTCLVLLTDGRLAELRRSGYSSTWDTEWNVVMRCLSPEEAVAAYSVAACAEQLAAELAGLRSRMGKARHTATTAG